MFRARVVVLGLVAFAAALPQPAEAHFKMTAPASWIVENQIGDPQKQSPCGGEGGTPSNAVTTFRPGQTITIEFQETIYHPGHFRIALAQNRADLIDPVVTVDANQNSVSATIEAPPVLPTLLDGFFPRTANSGPSGTIFTQDVTLPNNECRNCTLQLIQFMTGHGPPNYIYFHCATVDIVNEVSPPDAGVEIDATIEADAALADAAGNADAQVYPDAAVNPDAAETLPDAAVPDPDPDGGRQPTATMKTTGSCGCDSTTVPADSNFVLALLLLGLFAARYFGQSAFGALAHARRRAGSRSLE
jgi:MYXO-CTERM domain-containing protein